MDIAAKEYSLEEMLQSHKKDLKVEPKTLPDGSGAAAVCVMQIAYLGMAYAGVAAQKYEVKTIEGELTKALATIFAREIELTVCGRTDAGVNAAAQYISFPVAKEELSRNPLRIISGIHALCDDDISVRGIWLAPTWFSARQSAIERTYKYRIVDGISRPIATKDRAMWHRSIHPLDTKAMQKAANQMVGEHDFASFCKEASRKCLMENDASTKRFVRKVEVKKEKEATEDIITITVIGNAFLHNMVRIIVGTLVEVGEGRRSPESIKSLFEEADRSRAGRTAEAKGLTFESVLYPEDALFTWDSYVAGLSE